MIKYKVLGLSMVILSVSILVVMQLHHDVIWLVADILMFFVLGFGGFVLLLDAYRKVC